MIENQSKIETPKKSEALEIKEVLHNVESSEESCQQITSESEKETDQFKKDGADDLAQVENRASKNELSVDNADKDALLDLDKEAETAQAELSSEINLSSLLDREKSEAPDINFPSPSPEEYHTTPTLPDKTENKVTSPPIKEVRSNLSVENKSSIELKNDSMFAEKELEQDFLTSREQIPEEENLGRIAEKFFPADETKERSVKILNHFQNGTLLAHTANIEQIDSLLDVFNREREIKNLSTSLIAEGGYNALYGARGTGLLFDGEKVNLEHISKEDSSSSGQSNEFHASNHAKVESLKELADYLKSSEATSISEVNISLDSPKELLGILSRNSVSGKLDAVIMHIKMGGRLPLFVLVEKTGTQNKNGNLINIEEWKPSRNEVAQLIEKYPVKRARARYEKILKYIQ